MLNFSFSVFQAFCEVIFKAKGSKMARENHVFLFLGKRAPQKNAF
jgi:hypothetical protein